MSTTYVATTSHGADRWIVAIGVTETKDELRERAQRIICGNQWDGPKDIHTDTELKQLTIVTLASLNRTTSGRGMIDDYEHGQAGIFYPEYLESLRG